jgi:hypothetical protein
LRRISLSPVEGDYSPHGQGFARRAAALIATVDTGDVKRAIDTLDKPGENEADDSWFANCDGAVSYFKKKLKMIVTCETNEGREGALYRKISFPDSCLNIQLHNHLLQYIMRI